MDLGNDQIIPNPNFMKGVGSGQDNRVGGSGRGSGSGDCPLMGDPRPPGTPLCEQECHVCASTMAIFQTALETGHPPATGR